MIKQILKQIWNERRSNAWLWVELLLVSIVLWVIVDYGYVMFRTYTAPLGFSIDNTYLLRFSMLTPKSNLYIPAEQKTTTTGEDILAIMDRIRHRPDVEFVSFSQNAFPYNGSNSWNSLVHDSIHINRLRRSVTKDFFNVFRYENINGSDSQSLVDVFEYNTIIVPSDFLPPEHSDKELSGMEFYVGGDTVTPLRVAAVTNPVRYGDFSPVGNSIYYARRFMDEKIAEDITNTDIDWFEICVRVKPGTTKDFAETLMKESARNYMAGNCYIRSAVSFSKIRKDFHSDQINELKSRVYVVFFLLVNIFLGIIGTFWFRTQQRRAELGLRIAFGSTRRSLYRLLVSESLWILLFAFIPAIIICYNIGYANLAKVWQMEWGMARFIPGILITFFLMALMIMIGIWYPAHQATKIQPALVLHSE